MTPSLPVGTVDLWTCPLDPPDQPGKIPITSLPLNAEERARAERFRHPLHQSRFALGRSFMRRVLATYLGRSPSSVRLQVGAYGKPELFPEPGAPDIQFNLAHSQGMALCAVSLSFPVGVDLESVSPIPDLERLVQRCLTDREAALLEEEINHAPRLQTFLRLWTRKEALLKGVGVGLRFDPVSAVVADPDHPSLSTGDSAIPEEELSGWRLHDLTPDPGYVGCLAVRRTHVQIRQRTESSPDF